MSAAMKMEYTPIPLATVFDVDAIVNISYYKLENGYVFSGESHFLTAAASLSLPGRTSIF